MRSYQNEYIANLRAVNELVAPEPIKDIPFEAWYAHFEKSREIIEEKRARNMELLRTEFQEDIDNLFSEETGAREALAEFAAALCADGEPLDEGLCHTLHQILLSYYRTVRDRDSTIRELYNKGMGIHNLSRLLTGIEHPALTALDQRARMCFTEASAYRKYFDEIDSEETKGYIIRSMANVSLGRFRHASEKIAVIRHTLQVLNDDWYREQAPGLPWDRFLYLTHQQMVSSRSLASNGLTPQDLADIMESSHILYDEQLETAKQNGTSPNIRWLWPYYQLEYLCGLSTVQEMLGKMEILIEQAGMSDSSVSGMYGRITLPMTYCNILQDFPDQDFVWKKRGYLRALNNRTFEYVRNLPEGRDHAFYLNQFLNAYIELDGSTPYLQVLLTVLSRFAPDLYICSYIVAEASAAICETVLEEDPAAFDDIPSIGGLKDIPAKREAAIRFVWTGALLHDVGMIYFPHIRSVRGRELFQEEDELLELHPAIGWEMLKKRPSTREYADIALGHHVWYNGSGGYPAEYQRRESPCRRAVDVVALAVFLEEAAHGGGPSQAGVSFEDIVDRAVREEGRRFFPSLTVCLQEPALQEKLREIFANGKQRVCRLLFDAEKG